MKAAWLNNCVFEGTARDSVRRALVATVSQLSYICIGGKIGHHTRGPGRVLALYPPSVYEDVC